ncbi:hypothetical protein ARTHRO8AJ_290006 [Arthrobacter sp. 8AJ]|nr:hypothetical protein ARTHRO8AJ_290006 [Arthrobacter sp. 8AJ]
MLLSVPRLDKETETTFTEDRGLVLGHGSLW